MGHYSYVILSEMRASFLGSDWEILFMCSPYEEPHCTLICEKLQIPVAKKDFFIWHLLPCHNPMEPNFGFTHIDDTCIRGPSLQPQSPMAGSRFVRLCEGLNGCKS